MKKLLLLVLFSITKGLLAQSFAYELRTSNRAYVLAGYKAFELRNRVDLKENRVTYRPNVKFNSHFVLAPGVHYKLEAHIPTLEPRLCYKTEKATFWIQDEFWYHKQYHYCIAVDIPSANKKATYRIGWDNSNTIRFRVTVKI